jgi:hypothetical protein
MVRARAGKAVVDSDRFKVYDAGIRSTLRYLGWSSVEPGNVSMVCGMICRWIEANTAATASDRTIRRHLARRGLICGKGADANGDRSGT